MARYHAAMPAEPSTFKQFLDAHPFLIIGHRGAAGLVAENTLPSFERALALGCAGLELDVHRVSGNPPALCVIHDDTLNRTTNRRGQVSDLTIDDLALIDAGNGAPIPLLEDVIDCISQHQQTGQQVLLNIELKGQNTADLAAAYCATFASQTLVSSFNQLLLEEFRAADPTTPVALLYERWHPDWLACARALDCSAVNLSSRIVKEEYVAEIQAHGLAVFVYTVNSLRRAKQLHEMGVNGIFTDRPDKMGMWLG